MDRGGVILIAGLEETIKNRVQCLFEEMVVTEIVSMEDFLNRLEGLSSANVEVVICGPCIEDLQPTELAQSLKAQIPDRLLLYASSGKHRPDEIQLLKNGFDQTFFLPFDSRAMGQTLRSERERIMGSECTQHIPIPVGDLTADTVLDFDVLVLLPYNQRHVKIARKGCAIRGETLDNLSSKGIRNVVIHKADEERFEDYFATQKSRSDLQSLRSRKQSLHQSVRQVFRTLMAPGQGSFEEGNALLCKAQGIIAEVLNSEPIVDVLDRFFKQTGQEYGDCYEEAMRIAIYGTIFATALAGRAKPDDMALAGLFHHVGLFYCPDDIAEKKWDEMSQAERTIYMKHPEDSLRLIQEKRIVLVPEVQNAILQHHEKPDGTGYPKALPEHKICVEASLLALACAFDELTVQQIGKTRVTPEEAFEKISKMGIISKDLMWQIQSVMTKFGHREVCAS